MSSRDQQQRMERQYAKIVNNMAERVTCVVHVMGFSIKRPTWWDDQRKLIAIISVLKGLTSLFNTIAVMFLIASLSQNVKNKDWQLYTFDQLGNVEWIDKLKKIR